MPRPPRLDIPGLPQHLIARGNNRSAFFYADQDRHVFLHYLGEAATTTQCALHAYVLMTNHVHLLATGSVSGSISRLMQAIGRRYTRYVNHVHHRTGTLFEGRFKSSLVENDRYLFAVMRYIELNPVRAGMVDDPGRYPWSSFRQNSSGAPCGILTAHPVYERLGADRKARQRGYLSLFEMPLEKQVLDEIRFHASKSRPLSNRGQITSGNLGSD